MIKVKHAVLPQSSEQVPSTRARSAAFSPGTDPTQATQQTPLTTLAHVCGVMREKDLDLDSNPALPVTGRASSSKPLVKQG